MARLPNLTRDNVPSEFLEAFDEVTAESGGVITGGPGSITINSPEMARRRAYLTNYLRFESTFPKKIQELAIIVTARAMDCQYVWNAHAPAARNQGVADDLVDAIRDKKTLPNLTPDEAAIISYATEFFQTHKVSTPTFNSALEQFGSQHLVEITALIGHYTQTSMILNTFEVTLPEDRTEIVLPV